MIKPVVFTDLREDNITKFVGAFLLEFILILLLCVSLVWLFSPGLEEQALAPGLALGIVVTTLLFSMQFGVSAILTAIHEKQARWGVITGLCLLLILETLIAVLESESLVHMVFGQSDPVSFQEKIPFMIRLALAFPGGYFGAWLAIKRYSEKKRTPEAPKT